MFYNRVKTKWRAHYGYPIYIYRARLEKIQWRQSAYPCVILLSFQVFWKEGMAQDLYNQTCCCDQFQSLHCGALLGQSSYKTVHFPLDIYYCVMEIRIWHVKMTKSQGHRTGIYPWEGAIMESCQTWDGIWMRGK